ncbi:MAG: helix-turn-helix transcriptional regulator [Clostridia bacterium]|nr:helix-turn-helix transcriptional regulator [Clostridia bacterium]
MFDTTQIGKRISEFRKSKDMTQYELADKLSISFQAVSNWERGNSMPDISKLPELAEIFGVTIDDIIGHNNTVLHDVISSQSPNANEYSDADISEAAYLLKPSQIEDILINTDYHPRVLSTVLPFLSDKTIEEITDEHIKNGKSVAVLLPFLHYEKIEELVRIATENSESITMFMPFLRESAIKAFAFEVFEHGGISEASVFLPFMNEADILELMKLASQTNN